MYEVIIEEKNFCHLVTSQLVQYFVMLFMPLGIL